MKTNYIHDCIAITRNNGHVIESRSATKQVEELEKVNSELLKSLSEIDEYITKMGVVSIAMIRIKKRAKEAIKKTTE